MESSVRVILAGCGCMSRVCLRYLTARADVELVNPVDGRAAERAREFELPTPCFTDLGVALAGCDADLVCDTSVPDAHAGTAAATRSCRTGATSATYGRHAAIASAGRSARIQIHDHLA